MAEPAAGAVKLSDQALPQIAGRASVPTYDRRSLSPGIVHFGVGNFHRAHQACYLDALFEQGLDQDWAIIGAGLRSSDAAMRDRLAGQDWLTTVVEQEAAVSKARVIGPMIDFLPVGDTQAIIEKLTDPTIRIVSLTITEGGYFIDSASGTFDASHPEILQDAATPDAPQTVFGCILAALMRRRAAGTIPFTVMSCDNIPHNGAVTRDALAGLAELSDPNLARWVRDAVSFPNAMVDRITPATSDLQRQSAADEFGVEDAAPVFCEGFVQWVLEDRFPAGRPALERVGVELVPDVAPYETMKLRILNGGHALIAYPAALMGIQHVHDAMENGLIRGFLEKVEREEIIPHVPPVPNTDLRDYLQLIERRFANPKIADTIQRLCFDGSNRQPKFIIPSIRDRLRAGGGVSGLALASALWCRYCGSAAEPNDPNWERLQAAARAARQDPAAWLAMEDIYGEVGRSPVLSESFAAALRALIDGGTEAALQVYLADGD